MYIAVYLIIAYFRIRYPFELNWIEGHILTHVLRILSGKKIYVEPSLEFSSLDYPPIYYYLSAAASSLIGNGFTPLRLVSAVLTLGSFYVIYYIVIKETESKFSGILACCLFAATFKISGGYFDVARIDSLFLFFVLVSLYLIKFATSNKSYILAGVFISMASLTKQTGLMISIPLVLYCFFISWRSAILFIGTTVLIIGGGTLILDLLHSGWYYYYVFDLPRQIFTLRKDMLDGFWTRDLMASLSIAVVLSMFYLLSQLYAINKKHFLFYFLTSVGMIGASWLSRLHIGGAPNVLMPAYAIVAILFGLAFNTVFKFIKAIPSDKQQLSESFIYLIYILQFIILIYNPLLEIPTKRELEAGKKLIYTISQIKGEVYIPCHPYLAYLAGKKNYAHIASIGAIIKLAKNEQLRNKLKDELDRAIKEKKFNAIILNSQDTEALFYDFTKYYKKQGSLFDNDTVFFTKSGRRTRPEFIYTLKNNDTEPTLSPTKEERNLQLP